MLEFYKHSTPEGGPLSALDSRELFEMVRDYFLLGGMMSEARAATRARTVMAGQDESVTVEIK